MTSHLRTLALTAAAVILLAWGVSAFLDRAFSAVQIVGTR